MRAIHFMRRQSLSMAIPLVLMVTLLAACGTNTTTSGGNAPTNVPTSTSASTTGCPSNAVVSTSPPAANVVLKMGDTNSTVTAHNGDIIEVRLPFGQQWTGPTTSQGVLELQTPAGYASPSDKVCIWRFIAKGTGTTELKFYGRSICKKGAFCAQYVIDMPFTITVK